ncbi:hypothetical protein BOTBODRAFT_64045 [Botryobasidium botryosum FD-172 SS1]|uniref:Uncharacterized protein n=1 Tax=Botryobasidium botryosum (strain FD-172 SS1) TaxID=930990 RepID=A0A067N081_BOTB1|nr:hypothetical protein BOTBODRAFT_64045 [Botryobasidium botryosum FD-172 SS1]
MQHSMSFLLGRSRLFYIGVSTVFLPAAFFGGVYLRSLTREEPPEALKNKSLESTSNDAGHSELKVSLPVHISSPEEASVRRAELVALMTEREQLDEKMNEVRERMRARASNGTQ